MTTSMVESSRAPILIDLALQGGGAHGAFTWGVLDRLLEEPWLRIDGISGTSAGAMNAAALASRYSGAASRRQVISARCVAARSTSFSAAGRSTVLRLTSRWI